MMELPTLEGIFAQLAVEQDSDGIAREIADLIRAMKDLRAEGQFRVLYRVFLLRVIDLEVLSADADTAKLLGQFVAIFAGISFFFAAPLFILAGNMPAADVVDRGAPADRDHDHDVGLFSVLSWDSHDARPARRACSRTIADTDDHTFPGKALRRQGRGAGLVIVSLNVFTGLAWPLSFASSDGAIWARCDRSLLTGRPSFWRVCSRSVWCSGIQGVDSPTSSAPALSAALCAVYSYGALRASWGCIFWSRHWRRARHSAHRRTTGCWRGCRRIGFLGSSSSSMGRCLRASPG